jgi:CheY-like chemotaxis protein
MSPSRHGNESGGERRGPNRPINGDTRSCPHCARGLAEFNARYRHDGLTRPAWICENPRCPVGEWPAREDDVAPGPPVRRRAALAISGATAPPQHVQEAQGKKASPAPRDLVGRSAALREKSDALIEKLAALQERSLALRQRIGRLDWPDVLVLNVEDHAPARFLRTRTLQNAGYSVRETDSAEEALTIAHEEPSIRLALLDVGLPDGDGFRVCEYLKRSHPEMQVVMITSIYRSGAARLEGLGAGADEYLLDPVPGHRLVRALDRVLMPTHTGGPSPVITTDAVGCIVALNAPAATLLNLSARAAVGRNLLTFVDGERAKIGKFLSLASDGGLVQDEVMIRPKERKPLKMEVEMTPDDHGTRTVEWTLRYLRAHQTASQ